MQKILKRNVSNKAGFEIKSGSTVEIKFDVLNKEIYCTEDKSIIYTYCSLYFEGNRIIVRSDNLPKYIKGVKHPSINTLEKWVSDGIAKSIFGKRIEPDGIDSEGSPSWLLALGYI